MNEDKELYDELVKLRQHIKDTSTSERTPAVCTDEVLSEIANLVPVKLSDFESIPGVGKAFIENYGEQFLRVINRHERNTQGSGIRKVTINKSVSTTLKELEKKLVNINKRNHLLYMPKLQSKYAVDLFSGNYDARDILLGTGKKIEVANLKDEQKFKKITSLLRSTNRLLREKGQNNLFIAYPFVKGTLPGENFDVRCPLALFPVIEERSPTSIKLSLDRSRDALYNTTLILAYQKTNGLNTPLPPEEIEDTSRETFLESIKTFYKNSDLEIQSEESENEMHAFTDYTAESFPKFSPGDLFLENSIVIGNFPICSSSIQKDFQKIAEDGNINTLLNDLLSTDDEASARNETPICESALHYINELNSSQEKVLNDLNTTDELVVEGPPGTGKSQTITSLISQAALGGKTVLMVSEKKTALDVVYSRLGELSKYALIIDDVNNKNLFYSQMQKIVNIPEVKTNAPTTDSSEEKFSIEIDTQISHLEKIAKTLYTKDDFGIEPYKLYLKCPRKDFSKTEQLQREKTLNETVNPLILSMDYDTLVKCQEIFSNEENVNRTNTFTQFDKTFPWLSKMNSTLTDFDTQHLESQWQNLVMKIEEHNKKNFFARLFESGKIKKEIREFAKPYFTETNKEIVNLLMKKPSDFTEGQKHYTEYVSLKPHYDSLSEKEKLFFASMQNSRHLCNNSLLEAAKEIVFFSLYKHLMDFEATHRDSLLQIENFPETIRTISNDIQKKTKLTREHLEQVLYGNLSMLTQSKRKNDILRAIDSKRKMSVNKFISKFDFELFKAIKIWLLTPEVVSEIIPLQIGVFDLLIFDEASQLYVEKGLPSILRAKKVVVAGDQKQLRPSSLGTGRITIDEDSLDEDEEISAALEEESLLDLAKYKYKDTLLNFHYRSRYEELIAFSNYAFYNGKLYVSPNITTPDTPPIEMHKMEKAVWENRQNKAEAEYIVSLLKNIFATRQNRETIGIITFNTNQRDLIDDLIDKECLQDEEFDKLIREETVRTKDGEDIGLFVKNIENVQGDERDIIIFSIGYAKNESGKFIQNFGWLNQSGGENRLNVAISRAKQKVHVVVSFDPSTLNVDNTKNPGPAILKKYLEYADAVSSKNTDKAKQILLSFTDNEEKSEKENAESEQLYMDSISNALKEEGIEFDRNVGIGGYTIDFAIKKDRKYVLGLECDSRLYKNAASPRDRDYHRQKYLENRGWKLHRIWASSWWKNPDAEIQKITDIFDAL
ncbi:MAG TPA: HRDC domain protein [Treponema sp.]|nr:HRDC domain protein [Treponema sp.]